MVYKLEIPGIHSNTIIESDNVEFFEDIFPYKNEGKTLGESSKRPREITEENVPNIEEPQRRKRQRVPKSFGPYFLAFLLENEPQTFKEAMKSSEAQY